MLDLLINALSGAFAGSSAPGAGRRRRTAAEELVWALATLLLPTADFFLVMWLGGSSALALPVVFAAAVALLAVRLGVNRTLQLTAPPLTALFCLAASALGILLGADGFFGF